MDLERDRIRTVFHEQYPGLCRFLTGIVGASGAPDLAQESFLRLCGARLGEISDDEIRFWLFRVGRNLALNEVNRENTRKRLWRRAGEALSFKRPAPEAELERSEQRNQIRRLLAKLPEHQRSALLLRENEDMSYREIALVLAVSEAKVKIDIYRGREKLRELWNEENNEM
ncbi:MAG TPA: sigma-70 family RNA polymerase sigma factor [Aridibacter sp.]|nr:sigma-70 family RNA polymerase sigma factor [Aridibacter sp.]